MAKAFVGPGQCPIPKQYNNPYIRSRNLRKFPESNFDAGSCKFFIET